MIMSQEAENAQIISNSEANLVLVSYRDRINELRIQLAAEQSIRMYALISTIVCLSLTVVLAVVAILHAGLSILLCAVALLCSLALYRRYVHSGRRWKRNVQETDYFELGISRLPSRSASTQRPSRCWMVSTLSSASSFPLRAHPTRRDRIT